MTFNHLENPNWKYRLSSGFLALLTAFSLASPVQASAEHKSHEETQPFSFPAFAKPLIDKLAHLFAPPEEIYPQGITAAPCEYSPVLEDLGVEPNEAWIEAICEVVPGAEGNELVVNFDAINNPDNPSIITASLFHSNYLILTSISKANIFEATYGNLNQHILSDSQIAQIHRQIEQNNPITMIVQGHLIKIRPVHSDNLGREIQIILPYTLKGDGKTEREYLQFEDGTELWVGELTGKAILDAKAKQEIYSRGALLTIPEEILKEFPLALVPPQIEAQVGLNPTLSNSSAPAETSPDPAILPDTEPKDINPFGLENIPLANASQLTLSPSQLDNLKVTLRYQNPKEVIIDPDILEYHNDRRANPPLPGETNDDLTNLRDDISCLKNTWANILAVFGKNIDRPDMIKVKGLIPEMFIDQIQIDGSQVIISGRTKNQESVVSFSVSRKKFARLLHDPNTVLDAQLTDGSSNSTLKNMIIDLIGENKPFPRAITVSNEWLTSLAALGEPSQAANSASLTSHSAGYLLDAQLNNALYAYLPNGIPITVKGIAIYGNQGYYLASFDRLDAFTGLDIRTNTESMRDFALQHGLITYYSDTLYLLIPLNSAVLEDMSQTTSHPIPLARKLEQERETLNRVNPSQSFQSLDRRARQMAKNQRQQV